MRVLTVLILMLQSTSVWAEDYPTRETVQMVVSCMFENGGQTEENLYACACRHDIITSQMTFADYEQATVFERYRDLPGEKGQVFRDAKEGEQLLRKLADARKQGLAQCPLVKRVNREHASK